MLIALIKIIRYILFKSNLLPIEGLESGVVNEKSEFTVNTRDAGYGGLGLSIEGPSKAEINCVDNEDGTCTVDFVPTEPGDYTIHVRFADEEIPGSPFTCNVVPKGGERRPVVEEGISRDSVRNVESAPAQRTSQLLDDLVSFSPQQPHDFALDLKGYNVKDLKATVETPSGKTEPGEIVESTKDTYTIRFVTKEGGIYKVCMQLFAIIGCIAVWRNSQGGTRCIVFLGLIRCISTLDAFKCLRSNLRALANMFIFNFPIFS